MFEQGTLKFQVRLMTDPSNRTFTIDDLPWPASTGVGARVAGRYLLVRELGRGGGGSVYEARDEKLDELVAVKLIPILGLQGLPRVRREVTALRRARLPGVVRLRDDGVERGDYFLVMDRIFGHPFPGVGPSPRGWEDLRPVALRLLEILAAVHYAGLVHLDLKPANVLVEAGGQPWVLDFGIARGTALGGEGPAGFQGTLAYAAPEQIRGHAPGVQADLYAVGVMLYEALAGRSRSSGQMVDRWSALTCAPPVPLRLLVPDLPEHVYRFVDSLMAEEPAERPADAVAAIRLLGEAPRALLDDLSLPTARAGSEEELRSLFRGPDLFLHLREDAATELWRRTGGHPQALRAELRGWVSAGLAHREGPLVVVERGSLDRLAGGLRVAAEDAEDPPLSADAGALLAWIRLAWPDATLPLLEGMLGWDAGRCAQALTELRGQDLVWDLAGGRLGARPTLSSPGGLDRRAAQRALAEALPPRTPARLRHLLEGDAPADALIVEIMALDGEANDGGSSSDGGALIEIGLSLAREEGDEELELHMLARLTVAALQQESPGPIDRVLYELGRATVKGPEVDGLRRLLDAARAVHDGDLARAGRELEQISPFRQEDVEIWRSGVKVLAARRVGRAVLSSVLDQLGPWASQGSPERRARYLSWTSALRYREGRYGEAAALHQQAAALRQTECGRMISLLNAALALLEDQRLDEASAEAERAVRRAMRLREPTAEAHATWLKRTLAYRQDQASAPQPELVEAAGELSATLEALFAQNEAAVAWRSGAASLALELAARAERRATVAGLREVRLLCHGLRLACEGWPDRREMAELATECQSCEVPEISAQVLGLLSIREARPEWRLQIQSVAAGRSPKHLSARLDILSLREALEARLDRTHGENDPIANHPGGGPTGPTASNST